MKTTLKMGTFSRLNSRGPLFPSPFFTFKKCTRLVTFQHYYTNIAILDNKISRDNQRLYCVNLFELLDPRWNFFVVVFCIFYRRGCRIQVILLNHHPFLINFHLGKRCYQAATQNSFFDYFKMSSKFEKCLCCH